MPVDQTTAEWVGGAWDGRTLIIDRQLAIALLGKLLECPSHGAPFMVLADIPVGHRRFVRYQADNEVSEHGVLYLRAFVPTALC